MTPARKKTRFREWLTRVRLNMRSHPAAPQMGRAVGYGAGLIFLIILAMALQDSPLRGYAALIAAAAAMILAWKMRRALNQSISIMRPEENERSGIFRRMASVIKGAKKL